jgi:metal-responsive CopG/Arc/MetJ family transcriptional regulator
MKNVNVRVPENILEEFDSITIATGYSRAGIVRESIAYFRENGRIYVKTFGKELTYVELLEMSYRVLQESPDLKKRMEQKQEHNRSKKEKVDVEEAYENVVRAVRHLGGELESLHDQKQEKESE